MNLKLENGVQINLSDLDKLENKSGDNGLLKFFDGIGLGGNKNNIFDKKEIEKIKAFLIEMAGEDGVIDKNDIKKTKAKYASIFTHYSEQNMADDLSLLSIDSNSFKSDKNSPVHRVKSGDTIPKIVKELGYVGEDAKKYEKALESQLDADGSFMNDKKWLLAGSKIKLLSDEKLKALGITKAVSTTPAVSTNDVNPNGLVENAEDATKVTNPVKENYSRVTHTNSDQKVPKNPDDGVKVVKNSTERILEVIRSSGQKGRIISENELNDEQKKFVKLQKQLYKTNPTFIKNDSTGDVHIFFDTENSAIGKKIGLTSLEQIFGQNTQTTNRYYRNGKIVQDLKKYDNKDEEWKEVSSTLIQRPITGKKMVKKISTPLPIDIKVDPSVYEGASEGQKEDINQFIGFLKNNKASLMKDLNIDNDTYNKYVKLACAIAIQESNFGKADSYKYFDGLKLVTMLKDTVAVGGIGAKKLGADAPTAVSKGLTQIKIGDWDDNPRVEKLFAKYGITRGYYNTLTPEQSAAATVIVLNELSKTVKTESVQNGIEAANNKYFYAQKRLIDGKPVERAGGYFVYNNITDEDAMMYLYNGRSGTLKKGNATPDLMLYTHNIRRYKNLFEVTENKQQRAQALKKAPAVDVSVGNKRKPLASDLGWGIGQVVFNTQLYTGGVAKNNESEIQALKKSLVQRGFDMRYVNSLISKMQKGDISFTNGLTSREISAMTEADVKLLIEHSESLNKKLQGVGNAKKKREISTDADKEFKRAYLSSHARQFKNDNLGNSVVVLNDNVEDNVKKYPEGGYNTGAQKRCKRYLSQLRGSHQPDSGIYMYANRVNQGLYTGFNVEHDKGINYVNASDIDILLAQNSADTANTLRTSGACLTGAKQSLIGVGCVDPEEMIGFNNAFQLANFLEKHPERFEEIKYVQISDNVVREITSGDVSSLPAGCIVVYGNKARLDVPGHAGITNGNSQIAADEFDNSNWDNFVAKSKKHNGKGEHGYVRIFRINPDYYMIDPKTNKLVPKHK